MQRVPGAQAALVFVLGTSVLPSVAADPARATEVPTFPLRALALEADAVLRGDVIEEESVFDAERHRIYTLSHVLVREVLRGGARPGDVIVVKQMGGEVEGLRQVLAGTAPLFPGDEVVVFARTDGAFHYLVGMAQGVWHVRRAPGRAAVVARDPSRLALRPLPPLAAAVPPDHASLASFLDSVRATLAAEGEVSP